MATAKAWAEEAEAHWIAEENVVAAAAAARHRAVLAMTETEQDRGALSKQKGQAKGKQMVCNHCATWGFDCQVSQFICFFF